jgi:hypothetical protein
MRLGAKMSRSKSEIVEQPKSIPGQISGVEDADSGNRSRVSGWVSRLEALDAPARNIDGRGSAADEGRNARRGNWREQNSILAVAARVDDARQVRIDSKDRLTIRTHRTKTGPGTFNVRHC